MFQRLKKTALLIFLLAVILRFSYIYFSLGINTPPNDHDFWLEKVAVNFSNGGGYGLVPSKPTARKLPFFSLFLAGIYIIFGHSIVIARIFQIILGGLSALGVYLTAKTISGEKEGIISGIIFACDPLTIYISGWFLTENLFIPLIIYFFYFMVKYQKENKNQNYLIMAGMFLGMSSLTRAISLLLTVFIFIWSFFINYPDIKKILRDFFIIIAIMFIFVSTWGIRNYVKLGDFVLTETGSGKMFWGGNNPYAIGDTVLMTGSPRLFESNDHPHGIQGKDWRQWNGSSWLNVFLSTDEGASEKEVSDKYYKKGIEWITNHPIDFFKLLPGKIYYLWKFWSPHASLPDIEPGLFLSAEIYYYLMLVSAIAGLLFSFSTWKNYLILYLLIGNFTVSALIFFGDARQRMPVVPIITILAGLGITGVKKIHAEKYKTR
ncbi:MAG: glycosyltransferase family 39 protein [Candidatus Firestonebacteria bacterium]|nr:glycosyltransferase family 39 protein [Candidatus Firestonebacteria bacterium]